MSIFYKDWELEKETNVYPIFLIEKRIRTFFYSFTYIFFHYMGHVTSPKNWLVFFRVLKTYFGILPLKGYIFRYEKKIFQSIITSKLLVQLRFRHVYPSKWPSGLKFCETYLCSRKLAKYKNCVSFSSPQSLVNNIFWRF